MKRLLAIAAVLTLLGAGCPQQAAEAPAPAAAPQEQPAPAPAVAPKPEEPATSTAEAETFQTDDHLDKALEELDSVK